MGAKLKFDVTFYIFLFLIVYFNGFSLLFSYFLALTIHEYSHYLMAKNMVLVTESIRIYATGMDVRVIGKTNNKKLNILLFLIGPIVNIILFLITIAFCWFYPISYYYLRDFAYANVLLCVFNLLPIYPLDGGNALLEIFDHTKWKYVVIKVMKFFSVFLGILFGVLFCVSCFHSVNFTLSCISFFLLSNITSYKKILKEDIEEKLKTKIKETKIYVINLKMKYDDIVKCFSDQFFVQFYIQNDEGKIIKILSQDEIKKIYNSKLLGLK